MLGLVLAGTPATADESSITPVEAFARLPTFSDLEISPGGRFLAARVNVSDHYEIAAFGLSDSELSKVHGFRENENLSVDWFRWVSEDTLLLSLAYSAQRTAGYVGVVQTAERRLFSLDTKSGALTALIRNSRDELPVQIQDRIVSFLPDDPDHILVQYSRTDPATPNVYKVNVSGKGGPKRVQRGRRGVLNWGADAGGNIRYGWGVRGGDEARLVMREAGERKWRDFSHRVNKAGLVFDIEGFTAEANQLFVVSNHEGDPSGLYTFDITTDTFGPLIFKHSDVDIRSVRIDERTSQLLSVNFVDEELATKVFSRQPISDDIDRLKKTFDTKRLSRSSVSSDGKHAVVRIRGDNDAGQFLIYNSESDHAMTLPSQYPELDGVPLGKTVSTGYVARDGLEIPAFISLPPGIESLEDARELPFVIYPHGGPGAQDFLRFDFTVQFLTSRGYGVLQMNFRGSTGYGQAFKEAGSKEWGQAMQDDITDGVLWLIDNGYAARERIAILGGSYGGYAALMGAVKTPDLYRCAISFAGVADLPDLISWQQKFIAGAYSTRFIGRLWRDRGMLVENSPARRADEIRIPILLIHGDQDTVVEIGQSEKMARQLRRKGKSVEFIEFEDGDHHLSLYKNRLRYLVEIENFLDKCL